MARVSTAQVRTLIETNLADGEIDEFINTSNIVVNDRLSGEGLGSSLLSEIELYLAAHFVTMREEKGGLDKERFGDATDAYKGEAGTGFSYTRYGQQAMAMDTTGRLASAGKRQALFRTMPRTR